LKFEQSPILGVFFCSVSWGEFRKIRIFLDFEFFGFCLLDFALVLIAFLQS